MTKILVVEDSEGILFALRRFFEKKGMEVVNSPTVADALERCSRTEFDLIMLDFNLGKGDKGWSVAPRVRKEPDRLGTPKIIGMSATVGLGNPERMGFKSADFDLFVKKPFDLQELGQQVDELLGLDD